MHHLKIDTTMPRLLTASMTALLFALSAPSLAYAHNPTGIGGVCNAASGNYDVTATWTNPVQTLHATQPPDTTVSYLSPLGHDAPQTFTSGASCKLVPTPMPQPHATPIVINNNPTNANNNVYNPTNTNTNSQTQNQNQSQNQTQSQSVNNAGNNVGTASASAVNNSVYQAPITFIAPAGPCDRATVGATVTNYQYGIGVNVPIGRRIGCELVAPNRVDQCIRYIQSGIVVDNVDCHDVHLAPKPVAIVTPVEQPQQVVTRTVMVPHLQVYREPAPSTTCAPMTQQQADALARDLHLARRTTNAARVRRDVDALYRACRQDIAAKAIDGAL